MDIQEKDCRFFGIFGLSLCVAGLLLPFFINGISGEEAAGGFLAVAQLLALTFCFLGRKSKPGLVGMIITGIVVLLLMALLLIKAG